MMNNIIPVIASVLRDQKREAIISFKTAIFLILLLVSFSLFATPQDDYKKANDFYAKGNYESAIKSYEAIIKKDNISTDIFYNLGNAYYKTNNIPAAILNYEKALKLKPDNEDALFNLAMANKQTIDKIDRLPELFIGSTWRNLVTSRTVDSWAFYCVGVLFLSLLFFMSYLLMNKILIKKISFYAGLFFFGLSMFSFLMAAQNNAIVKQTSEAIIFAQTVTINSEPNENSEDLFTLHEGTKVKLLEETDNWSKIKIPNGNVGWIKSEKIKHI